MSLKIVNVIAYFTVLFIDPIHFNNVINGSIPLPSRAH